MAYRVFEVRAKDRSKLDETLADDPISRQSITIRDARSLGLADRDTVFVLLEGQESVLLRAEEMILQYGRRTPLAEELYARIKAEEDEAASGLGFILGG